MKKIVTFGYLFLFCFGYTQTQEERQEIIKNTNVEALANLKSKFLKEKQERELRIQKFLIENPSFKRKTVEDFTIQEIYDVVDNDVQYFKTSNSNSAITSRANKLYSGGGLGLNIQGQNMTAYIWDGGIARTTHSEFNNKVFPGDSGTVVNHATHVTGTIVAIGNNPLVKGIAFQANAYTYDWTDDYIEMTDAAATGMLVSNHSYWSGSSTAVWTFGSYDNRARNFDLIAFDAPYYLAVTAAGNDRNDFTSTILEPYLSAKGGYNLTRGMQNAKNYLTVGAVDQVLNYTDPSSVIMSDFSSWGPTDDGRIKPDIVTKGTSVRSTTSNNDSSTGISQGTSMASPGIAGTALLLQQYYKSINPVFMRAATLKGLLLHTADEAGWEQGPDYEYGWGLINAEKAANLITKKPSLTSIIEENVLNNSQTFTKTIYATGTEPITVSISWTDRAGTSNTGTVDPTNLNIVNDLDVRIIKNTTNHFPWTLDPANPWNPAVRTADNFRDNFEKIEIDTPSAGEYTILITHKNTLVGNSQNFSLIVSGINQNLSNEDFNSDSLFINIYPNPTQNVLNFSTTENTNIDKISILDISGKEIFRTNSIMNNTIDVSSLLSGVYFVKFSSEEKSIVKKFIKE